MRYDCYIDDSVDENNAGITLMVKMITSEGSIDDYDVENNTVLTLMVKMITKFMTDCCL